MSAYNINNGNRFRHQTGAAPGGFSNAASSYQQYGEETDPNSKDMRLKSKISMLKEVSISIGDEIRDQNKFLGTLDADMESMGGRLAATMKSFYEMWARQGCGPFFYLTLFALAVFVFLYMYLKTR
ncbi:protein transport protein bet1 [Coemansia sp. RSA 1722]|nr:protein transport protein bet1 [Coemansia sp. RSA 485]KAJ2594939.1 protein transport protein bet1 [Coemansia sp. RSA 1722]KAJ2598465.1 protein transport protein bet1 [Coemansia sp. RSA 1721]KAJ2639268.1 protein transport protein bet1 [Coemansia sp. RSA 1286]KAJ2706814.1 protein transport protein bet1 [Coemansia sp. IMI 203386]